MVSGVAVLGSAIRSIESGSGSQLYGSVSVLRSRFDTDVQVGSVGGCTLTRFCVCAVDPYRVFQRVCFELCVLL